MPWKLGVWVSGICSRRQEFFWLCDLKLGQAMRNLACGDQSMLLVLCRLLTAKTRSVRELSQKPAFIGCRLSTRVFSVYLVDELVLAFYNRLLLVSFFLDGEWGEWWAGEYSFSILGVNAILIYLFIISLFYCLFIYSW